MHLDLHKLIELNTIIFCLTQAKIDNEDKEKQKPFGFNKWVTSTCLSCGAAHLSVNMGFQRSFKERWMQHQRQLNPQPAVSLPEHSSNTPQSFDSNQHRLSQIQSAAGQAEQPAGLEELSQSLSQSFMSYYSQFSRRMATSTQEPVQQSYTPESDGTISFSGGSIGPFLGEWQGVPRKQAHRRATLSTAAKPASGHRYSLARRRGNAAHWRHLFLIKLQMLLRKTLRMHQAQLGQQQMTLSALGAAVPEKSLRQIRGELAVRQARLTYQEGQEKIWKWQLGNQWPQQRTADHPTERGQPRIKP